MGSCENLTSVDEPSCNSVFEQHSSLEFMEESVSEQRMCLKTRFDVLDANVNGSTTLDGCLGLSIDDATHCVSCGDAGDTGIGNKDGLIDEFQNVVGVSLEKAMDDECGVGRVCFIESQEEIGVCSSPGRCLDLSQDGNHIYVSSAYVTEAVVGDRDASVSKSDNVSGSGLEKLVDESQSKVDSEAVVGDRDGPASECDNVSGSVLEKLVDEEQGVCLDGSQSEVDVCGNGLCVEKGGFQGEDLESFKHQKLPLGEVPSNCSPRNCDRRDKQKDDQGFNRSSVEETVEVMGVETNALAVVKLGNDIQTLSSDAFEMPLKSIPVGGLTRNCVQQHGHKGDNILSCLPGEEGVMIKKSDELAELEKVPCDLIMPFGSFGIPLTGSPRNCVQHGDQKDGTTVSCSSSEGDMEGKEVKTDALDGIEKVNCFQISPSQFCEMPPELLPFTGSPNNSVQQEDQKNDNTAFCTSSEGDMECIEEKTDALSGKMKVTCDQMLPSQCCEMDSEAISLVDSPTDCVQLGNQENNKNGGSLSSKSAKEVIEDKMGTCGQILPSQGCSMTPELIPKTDSLRNCTQQNEQKSNKCICVPSLEEEGKNYASVGIEIDICGHMVSFQECEIRSESTLVTEKQLIVEAKRDIVHGLENDSGHPRSPLEHTEPRMEFTSATDLSFSCIQKKEQQGIESSAEGKANLSAAVEANMWKANLAAAVEANMCNCIPALQDGETPFKVFYGDDLMRTCEGHKDHESIGHLAVGTVEQKDNTDTCIVALPMQSCQISLESLLIADSLSNCSQQNDQGNNKSVDGLSAESATEAVEEKSDVTTDIKVEICSQLSPIEENEKEHSSRVIKKPISLQSCQPSAVDENGSCKSLNVAGLSQKDGFGAISSSGAVDGFGQIDHEVKDDVGTNCFSETKYPNRVSLSSRRSSRISRSSQKTQTKRAARNCRTKAKIQHSHGSIDIMLNIARRKRSCLSKPARSSIWGLLGSITQIFGKSCMSSFNLSQNQGSQKARGDHRSQKRNKIQASGSSLTPSKKWNVSTRCLRLKVKVGKEICQSTLNVVVPKVADTMGSNDIVVGDDISGSHPTKNSEFPILAHEDEDIFGEEGTQRQFQCLDSNPEEVVKHPGDSIMDVHFASQESKATVITDNAAGDVADGNSAHKAVGILGGASENNYVDPGTSPDSEVINTAPDSEVGTRSKEGSHKVVLTSSEIFAAPGNVTSSRRGKKKTNLLFAGNCNLHDDSPVAASKVKPPKKRGSRQKLEDGSHSSDSLVAFPVTYASSNSSSGKEFCGELLSSRDSKPGIIEEAMVPSVKCKGSELSKSFKLGGRKKGRSKVSNSAKSRRRKASTQRGNQRKSVNKNEVKEKGVLAAKRRDEGVLELVEEKTEVRPQIGSHIAEDTGKTDSGNNSVSVDVSNAEITSGGEPEHYCPPESAWVRCDDCYKWRRIPVSVADLIDENCRWVCKDNMDTTFADCSIPQEKTNADINAELGLSDYEEEDGLINYNTSGKGLDFQITPGSSFRRIDSNVFLHRSRKTQTIDEVMVCHCKPPLDVRLGCRDECLNRMLNIECVQGTCPCGDLCSNQQFQKRKYAKMQWRPCGKKGYGLESLEDIPTGKFIIEYVGECRESILLPGFSVKEVTNVRYFEVLDMQAYEARQKEYAANGHKHFYFMTLNGSEVIDACAKGNLGRFINHSCDPNCRTEKWMVNGEICIGLFAMRDIKEGEELTFDYNYVRVFGAAAKKCHCGSPQCRGYIGGDPLNTEIIYQGDSDEEYPEPLMLEDGETGDGFKTMSRTSPFYGDRTQISEAIAEDTNKMDDSATAVGQLEISGNVNDSKSQSIPVIPQLHHSLEREDSKGKCPPLKSLETSLVVENESSIPVSSVQQKETMNKTSSVIPQVETSLPALISGNLFTDGSDAGRKSKSDIVEDNQSLPKSHPRIKTSRKSGSIKKGKVEGSPLSGNKVKSIASKSQVFFIKPKKIMEGSSNGRFEAVQEKLNELLDAEGGISKRKDAPKGYLKLLLLTAASGGSGNGESIQSNRDLSMILDALLKTKSRVVLMDIINKNGLQMLHNMIKQYRRDFKKIPILRKLLKVLEYLAVREILTRNHITAGPPCPGMESFRGSILSLTEHDDKQVHQIARSFRDRWIPKPFRKHSYKDRDDGGMDIHRVANCNRLPMLHNHRRDESLRPSEAIDCLMQSLVAKTTVDTAANEAGSSPGAGGCQTNGPKVRKRKSRWDQPAETNLDSIKHKKLMLESRVLPSREDINCPDHIHNHCNKDEAVSSEDGGQITQEDVPPGFSSPFNPPLVSSDSSSTTDLSQQNVSQLRCSFDVAIAHPQGKFNSRLPVSYGIPLHTLQQFGSSQAETVDSWVIAPSMPFHPFPPLPPFSRDKKDTPPASAVSCKTIDGPAEEWQQDSNHAPRCCPDEDNPSMTEANQSDADIPGTDAQHTFKRMRGSSNDLGKRYFRQQKRKGPPWLWRRNELRSSYCSQDVSCRVDKPVSSFIQRPPQQNHH